LWENNREKKEGGGDLCQQSDMTDDMQRSRPSGMSNLLSMNPTTPTTFSNEPN